MTAVLFPGIAPTTFALMRARMLAADADAKLFEATLVKAIEVATTSGLYDPDGVAVDSANGDVYVADTGNGVVEQVSPAGQLSVIAGNASGGVPTPGPATSSGLGSISGVAVNSSTGVVYIADTTNNVVEAVTPAGQLSIVAGSVLATPSLSRTPGPATASSLSAPFGLAVNSTTGELFIADTGNHDVESVSFS